MAKPYENIKVLDLTRVLAGPYCTMLLQELGAEILKVEVPEIGDDARYFGPFRQDQSLYFLSINHGKKSLALNLKTAQGKQILVACAKQADVIVENFRPGTMEKLGLGYESLHTLNPRLIYAATSGFGHTGPDAQKPGYDLLVQALGGMMSITGWPGMPPTRVGASIGDIGAALFTAIGISAALYQREKTGCGQKIDVAMLDCQIALLENAIVRYQVEGTPPGPLGSRHPTITPFQAFQTQDDYIAIAIGNDSLWKTFCQTIERVDLIDHVQFNSNRARTDNLAVVIPLLEEVFRQRTTAAWLTIFEQVGLPCSPIQKIDQALAHPQLAARNMVVEVNDPVAGVVKIAGNPIKMSTIPEEPTRQPAPAIGEHSALILHEWLGYSASEIVQLRADGVIG